MRFTVQLFAQHRARHGASIEVEAEPSVDAVLAALAAAGVSAESSRLAVDEEFALGGESLRADSRLALIPPVSGG